MLTFVIGILVGSAATTVLVEGGVYARVRAGILAAGAALMAAWERAGGLL